LYGARGGKLESKSGRRRLLRPQDWHQRWLCSPSPLSRCDESL